MSLSSGTRYAQPSDPDLDFDLDAVVIDNVFELDHELLLNLSGGFGSCLDASTGEKTDLDEICEFVITMRFSDASNERLRNYVVAKVNDWCDRGVMLRVLGAPGAYSTLIEDLDSWLPFPRSPVSRSN